MQLLSQLFNKLRSFKAFIGRVARLSLPYFKSDEKWHARGFLLMIVLLNLGTVFMAVQFNDWYKLFYNALEKRDQAVFWTQLGRFSYLAFGAIIIAVYKFYLTQLLEMRWRKWMTTRYLERWLANQTFYKLELMRYSNSHNTEAITDNPDQRISEDANQFTSATITLSMGFLDAVVTLVSFVGILWALSGDLSFTMAGSDYNIPGFMVWAAIVYCVLGSVLTHYIGRAQIKLHFFQQRYEADFRHHMVRVREYSEAIALDKGENVEIKQLGNRFATVLANYLRLIQAQKRLIWFTTFFSQAAVIFPFIVAAPRFFKGAIQLGELIQISSAFGQVQDSLSWFVENYSDLAAWRATTDRLTSFNESMEASEAMAAQHAALAAQSAATAATADQLTADDLTLALPNGQVLLAHTTLAARAGDTILLSGPSGSGKSTLFRAFAGIWPFSTGRVHLPANAMFIPQRPYFPNGSLRDALAYPELAAKYTDTDLQSALTDALLPHLVDRLDDQDAWGQILSGGEQQRLAIARVLLKKPQWIFADEATSALDVEAENTLYKRLLASVLLAKGAIVSIAHKPDVAAFHAKTWTLEKSTSDDTATAAYAVAASQRP
jgi:vitamin B12/bleomycin/antimicrobial peptide transport system ATP-binding/permease protein